MAAVDEGTGPEPQVRAKGGARWGLVLVTLLILGAGGGGGAWYLKEIAGSDVSQPQLTAQYLSLDPEFIVNFRHGDRVRFLQAGLKLVAYEPRALEAAKEHMPIIRHELLMLLSQQEYDDLIGSEGKEALRVRARKMIRELLEQRARHHEIEDVLFTKFVIQ